jgi:hypothetical protein
MAVTVNKLMCKLRVLRSEIKEVIDDKQIAFDNEENRSKPNNSYIRKYENQLVILEDVSYLLEGAADRLDDYK